ncbi:MAG: hypothetical protein IJJ33_12740 [Victivallales bacterium]|nr:hypothetical protein [Victivallales bacterium]
MDKMSDSKVRIGLIGLGPRGETLTATLLMLRDEIEIVAICDLDAGRLEAMKQ